METTGSETPINGDMEKGDQVQSMELGYHLGQIEQKIAEIPSGFRMVVNSFAGSMVALGIGITAFVVFIPREFDHLQTGIESKVDARDFQQFRQEFASSQEAILDEIKSSRADTRIGMDALKNEVEDMTGSLRSSVSSSVAEAFAPQLERLATLERLQTELTHQWLATAAAAQDLLNLQPYETDPALIEARFLSLDSQKQKSAMAKLFAQTVSFSQSAVQSVNVSNIPFDFSFHGQK